MDGLVKWDGTESRVQVGMVLGEGRWVGGSDTLKAGPTDTIRSIVMEL